MPVQVRVFVRDNEAYVWPPTQFVSSGDNNNQADSVEFLNLTNDEIQVMVPVDVFTNPSDHHKKVASHGRGAGTAKRDGSAGAKPKGTRIRYQVFCVETNSYAIGNSPPELIIE
jgi:hypothetical protein